VDLQGIPFTNVYRSMLTSSIWTTPHPRLHMIRCVWMTLMLMADRRGYVHSSVPGLAAQAVVSIEEAEEALELFRGPDKYSRTKEYEGRRIVDVAGGWRLLNYEAHRDATLVELAKQSKRDSYHRNKGKASPNDGEARQGDPVSESAGDDRQDTGLDGSPLDLAASRALSSSSLLDTDQDRSLGEPDQIESRDAGPVGGSRRGTVDHLDGWEPKPDLYARAAELGLSREVVDQRIGELRTGPVGGARGVFPHKRDEYVLQQLPKWRTWKETDAAKAARAAAAPGPGVRRAAPGDDIATTDAATAFRATNEHREFCRAHKLDVERAVREFRAGTRPAKLGTLLAQEEFTHRLKCWASTGVFYADGPMPKAPRATGAA
jgi:hypothetical protein